MYLFPYQEIQVPHPEDGLQPKAPHHLRRARKAQTVTIRHHQKADHQSDQAGG